MSEDRTRMNDGGHEDRTTVPEWASALTEAIPVPAAVMSPDGRVLHANSCLRLAAKNDESHGALEALSQERRDRVTDQFPGLRRLLDGAARTGSAVERSHSVLPPTSHRLQGCRCMPASWRLRGIGVR